MKPQPHSRDPRRFDVPSKIAATDKAVRAFVGGCGFLVVVGVFGLFLFLVWQVLPLFKDARVEPQRVLELNLPENAVYGADDWQQLLFSYVPGQQYLTFYDLAAAQLVSWREEVAIPDNEEITFVRYDTRQSHLLIGFADGCTMTVMIDWAAAFDETGKRSVKPRLLALGPYPIGKVGHPVTMAEYAFADTRQLVVVVQQVEGHERVYGMTLVQKRTLLEAEIPVPDRHLDLSYLLPEDTRIDRVLIMKNCEGVLLVFEDGRVRYLVRGATMPGLRQEFFPFEDLGDVAISQCQLLPDDRTLVCVSEHGDIRSFALTPDEHSPYPLWVRTKNFAPLSSGQRASFLSVGTADKAFLTGSGNAVSLLHNTTARVRWRGELPFELRGGFVGAHYTKLNLLDTQGNLHIYDLDDPHPDGGWGAFFSKIWYEDAPRPSYAWQTGQAGGTEAKFSLVPLIFGTLKGMAYAMAFALPLALLSAVYTSQFLHSRAKGIVKSTMEMMASLPSVVLGLLAVLWLAPLLETRVPNVLGVLICVPLGAVAVGFFWNVLVGAALRRRMAHGRGVLLALPVVLLCAWGGWALGPWLERMLFVVQDPETLASVADFRLWWEQVAGLDYRQQNALIVGIATGFAALPLIFTLAEDALSSVPAAMTNASLALGASRWQTCRRVVLPAAASGVLSAALIGMGRAAGETMILLLAAGNTPLMQCNLFSGLRAISNTILTELPAALPHSTHFRALLLGALVLLLFTCTLNSAALVLRRKWARKYKSP